jgi:hypothetical protein
MKKITDKTFFGALSVSYFFVFVLDSAKIVWYNESEK